jgi:hypothetical protein
MFKGLSNHINSRVLLGKSSKKQRKTDLLHSALFVIGLTGLVLWRSLVNRLSGETVRRTRRSSSERAREHAEWLASPTVIQPGWISHEVNAVVLTHYIEQVVEDLIIPDQLVSEWWNAFGNGGYSISASISVASSTPFDIVSSVEYEASCTGNSAQLTQYATNELRKFRNDSDYHIIHVEDPLNVGMQGSTDAVNQAVDPWVVHVVLGMRDPFQSEESFYRLVGELVRTDSAKLTMMVVEHVYTVPIKELLKQASDLNVSVLYVTLNMCPDFVHFSDGRFPFSGHSFKHTGADTKVFWHKSPDVPVYVKRSDWMHHISITSVEVIPGVTYVSRVVHQLFDVYLVEWTRQHIPALSPIPKVLTMQSPTLGIVVPRVRVLKPAEDYAVLDFILVTDHIANVVRNAVTFSEMMDNVFSCLVSENMVFLALESHARPWCGEEIWSGECYRRRLDAFLRQEEEGRERYGWHYESIDEGIERALKLRALLSKQPTLYCVLPNDS